MNAEDGYRVVDYFIKIHQKEQQRFEAALAFAVAACDDDGMANDSNIRYAVEQADRLFKELEK